MKPPIFGPIPDTGRGPSRVIWDGMDPAYYLENPTAGLFVDDDMAKVSPVGISASGMAGPFYCFLSTGATIVASSTLGGGITLTSDGDNEAASVQRRTKAFRLSSGTSYGKLVYEASISTSVIDEPRHGIFVGLTDGTANAATVPIADDGTLADINLIGFHRLEGDGDKLDIVYKASGQTAQTVLADAITLVADTVVKVAMVYDPSAAASEKITFYKDGERISGAAVTATQMAAATFPSAAYLNTCFGVKLATASSPGNSTYYWGRVAQET